MFFVSIILFLVGIFTLGISFSLEFAQPFVFIAGVLIFALGLALPIHFGGWSREHHGG